MRRKIKRTAQYFMMWCYSSLSLPDKVRKFLLSLSLSRFFFSISSFFCLVAETEPVTRWQFKENCAKILFLKSSKTNRCKIKIKNTFFSFFQAINIFLFSRLSLTREARRRLRRVKHWTISWKSYFKLGERGGEKEREMCGRSKRPSLDAYERASK